MFKVCGYRNHEWLTESLVEEWKGSLMIIGPTTIGILTSFHIKKATLSDLENYKNHRC
ncbi:hypothetical protein [Lysinibacillus sp. NPDC093688]|uniref:hypothetical protein n=1 Tax=Lysinibacillus sp. NPDC093688 TaxID=3390577 RepID=UPI003D094971